MSQSRYAGLLERYNITRNTLGMYSCVVVGAQYVTKDGEILDWPTLYSALAKLIQRFAPLGVYISGETSSQPGYSRLQTIDLSAIVRFVDDPEGDPGHALLKAMQAELQQAFETAEGSLPLWRVVVLKDGMVLWVYHHAIADGKSGLAFHRALFAALNEANQPPVADPPIVLVPQELVMVPPVETLTDLSPPLSMALRELARAFLPTSLAPLRRAWTGKHVPKADILSGVNVRFCAYAAPEAKRMLQLCRAHKATLTGIIHALLVVAISEAYVTLPKEMRKKKYTCLTSTLAVSLRPLTKTPDDAMCNEVSVYDSFPRMLTRPQGQTSWLSYRVWETASALSNTVRENFDRTARRIGLMKYVSENFDGYFKGHLGHKRHYTIQLSNLGRFALPDVKMQKWLMADTCFVQSQTVSAAMFSMNVIDSPSGGVNVTLTWNSNAIDESFGDLVFSNFKGGMYELSAGADAGRRE